MPEVLKKAVKRHSEFVGLFRSLGDPRSRANALIGLGQNSLRLGNIEKGEVHIKDGVEILEQIGDRSGIGFISFGEVC
jgi:hypothetical protein